MKIETKAEKASFKPVTITITFEQEEELLEIWHRLNMGHPMVKRYAENVAGRPPMPALSLTHDLWNVIDRLIK